MVLTISSIFPQPTDVLAVPATLTHSSDRCLNSKLDGINWLDSSGETAALTGCAFTTAGGADPVIAGGGIMARFIPGGGIIAGKRRRKSYC